MAANLQGQFANDLHMAWTLANKADACLQALDCIFPTELTISSTYLTAVKLSLWAARLKSSQTGSSEMSPVPFFFEVHLYLLLVCVIGHAAP